MEEESIRPSDGMLKRYSPSLLVELGMPAVLTGHHASMSTFPCLRRHSERESKTHDRRLRKCRAAA